MLSNIDDFSRSVVGGNFIAPLDDIERAAYPLQVFFGDRLRQAILIGPGDRQHGAAADLLHLVVAALQPDRARLAERRDLQREADQMGRKVLKGLRWLLLKHNADLDEKKNETNS